ncbi:hypothetical protein K3495_g14875 [Podosphaera aphanis]|nr:hypothetical protein K3495_g14875 [Podosphaera aphanis]
MSVTPDIAIFAFPQIWSGENNLSGSLDEDQEVNPPSTPQTQRHIFHNWNEWPTPTDMPSRKDGYDYVQRRLDLALNGEPIMPSVRRVTQKLESSAQ